MGGKQLRKAKQNVPIQFRRSVAKLQIAVKVFHSIILPFPLTEDGNTVLHVHSSIATATVLGREH